MIKKNTRKKLSLSKETIAHLSSGQMEKALGGGVVWNTRDCTISDVTIMGATCIEMSCSC